MSTAVVVGAGPNGLAAAVRLAQAGLQVTVLEAADEIGGGTRSSEAILPGLLHDHCSAIHPMAVGSQFLAGLGEPDRGGQAVRPGPHDNSCAHAKAPWSWSSSSRITDGFVRDLVPASDQVTSVGIGPLGSQGCSLTASPTFQVPRSITPSAASMSL